MDNRYQPLRSLGSAPYDAQPSTAWGVAEAPSQEALRVATTPREDEILADMEREIEAAVIRARLRLRQAAREAGHDGPPAAPQKRPGPTAA
jgi:hypothetical protein